MGTDLFQASILEHFRKQKTRLGSVTLTLFLVSWLNLLVQPCLMAAPTNDCHESTVHHQTALLSDSAVNLSANGVMEPSSLEDCRAMESCICGYAVNSSPALSGLDPEKKLLVSVEYSAQIWPNPVSFYRSIINQEPLYPGVPKFIQNCAFLV